MCLNSKGFSTMYMKRQSAEEALKRALRPNFRVCLNNKGMFHDSTLYMERQHANDALK